MNDFIRALYILLRCLLYPFEMVGGLAGGFEWSLLLAGVIGLGVAFYLGRRSVN